MIINYDERNYLIHFIGENEDIFRDRLGLSSIDISKILKPLVNRKSVSIKHQKIIIKAFMDSDWTFNQDTPNFIRENPECIKHTICKDINSVNYLIMVPGKLKDFIVEEVLKSEYVLTEKSPVFLLANFQVALHSIKLDCSSADYIFFGGLSSEETQKVINAIVNSEYVLSDKSHILLSTNVDVVLSSIKKRPETIEYASKYIQENEPRVFRYLLLNKYPFSCDDILKRPLDNFMDFEVLKKAFQEVYDDSYDLRNSELQERLERLVRVYLDALKTKPQFKTYEPLFQYMAEEQWQEYRCDNFENYDNVLGKILSELRSADTFDWAISNLSFIDLMEKVLGDKYNLLYNAMYEYFCTFHSATERKTDKLLNSKDIISKLSSLYVAKSKEDYKKHLITSYQIWLGQWFKLKLEHPYVRKKIIQMQKRELFVQAYKENDSDVYNFINRLVKAYGKKNDKLIIDKLIRSFIEDNCSKIEYIIKEPLNYSVYQRYEKSLKLIRRLNIGYIKYDGVEVFNYRDIIGFDDERKEYVYTGEKFTEHEINECNKYKELSLIFEQIKKDIIFQIDKMDDDVTIEDSVIKQIESMLPATDEYFEFDSDAVLIKFTLEDLEQNCVCTLDNVTQGDDLNLTYNLLVDKGLLWFLLFHCPDSMVLTQAKIYSIICNTCQINSIAKTFKFDLNSLDEILMFSRLIRIADFGRIAVLGTDLIVNLCGSKVYTGRLDETILDLAFQIVCEMPKRSKSTVPFVSGEHLDYRYSLYDVQDESILLSGIYTDSCFRVDGNDHDFLCYCALDKNGFVIKITNELGEFIARASGFRNGNCVFINQLRTIYDKGGDGYFGTYQKEQEEIIATFKAACEDIVKTSQDNFLEENKIDYVFVTRSYALADYPVNVNEEVKSKIGYEPMDVDSQDYKDFYNNNEPFLQDIFDEDEAFGTDYGDYDLICMSSVKDISKIECSDLKLNGDVPALYERKRNPIIISSIPNTNVYQKINKIKGIHSFFWNNAFVPVDISDTAITFVGDNWYIIYDENRIVDSCLLYFDSKAMVEFEATKQVIDQYSLNRPEFDVEQLSQAIMNGTVESYAKTLKPKTKK